MEITEGIIAPDFCLPNFEGRKVCLQDFKGSWVVLYFYPKDMTPGCTKEACDFRDNYSFLKKKGIEVIGVSRDDEKSHKKFSEKYNLNFSLLSDKDGGVSKKYKVLVEKNMYGKKVLGIERSTFIINPEGKIEKIFRKVKVENHLQEIKDFFKEIF